MKSIDDQRNYKVTYFETYYRKLKSDSKQVDGIRANLMRMDLDKDLEKSLGIIYLTFFLLYIYDRKGWLRRLRDANEAHNKAADELLI